MDTASPAFASEAPALPFVRGRAGGYPCVYAGGLGVRPPTAPTIKPDERWPDVDNSVSTAAGGPDALGRPRLIVTSRSLAVRQMSPRNHGVRTTPTILPKKFEELRQPGAFMFTGAACKHAGDRRHERRSLAGV
jgi:hypothetical protein